jgi:hypothetical protein
MSKANAALLRIQMARSAGTRHQIANLLKSEVSREDQRLLWVIIASVVDANSMAFNDVSN